MNYNKSKYYEIYSEFYSVNKFRKLKTIIHHGDNRLNHINRVAKMSFFISSKLNLDYISCTRGALMHDFFTTDDISKMDSRYKDFLKSHPKEAYNNASRLFEINEIEKNIILTHMFPITKEKPKYREAWVVNISDKLVSFYEFFRYEIKANVSYVKFSFYKLLLKY